MKNLLRCPKCSSKRLWVIEKYRIPGESAEGRALPVVPHQQDSRGGGLFSAIRLNPQGHFDLYLCDGCGYSELWAEGFKALQPDPARGIRLVDNSDLNEGPFR